MSAKFTHSTVTVERSNIWTTGHVIVERFTAASGKRPTRSHTFRSLTLASEFRLCALADSHNYTLFAGGGYLRHIVVR